MRRVVLSSRHCRLFHLAPKLVSSSITGMPLRTQYVQCEPNSVFSWLERWTASLFWKQTLQGRKITGSKPQAKKNNYAMETESGRSKRGVRRNTTSNIDSGTSVIADHEKPKRTLRKISSSTVDSITENPQSELEKVKRSLRKVSNSMAETLGHVEVESDKLSPNLKNVSNTLSFVPYQSIEGSVEERKHDLILTSETQVDLETESNSIPVGVIVVPCDDSCIDKLHPLQSINGDGNIPILMNGGLASKEDQTYNENQKSGKRRASFATKSEYEENGIQATPTLPSYMAATESAKAKLRAQTSLKVGSDSVEKNGVTRRHSLPSSNNSKLSSQSPRTQRFAHANGKCVAKNDRTLLSSRDGHGI
ncbi:Protein IQ-DOMAIN 31 [Dendrobium catenatum]|uniref:Protein IQ-DOMAIN 31 n=1 Tax=Dendrobium catenatum TaxID=906689 RepID=A0A2I0VZ58_9ASPA|nr:Protein IQ-DOMAIN 31 [Dendrobium catenatum]